MTIYVEEAHLHTVEVSIQTVRIGKKQMTLSVYKQLQREESFTDIFEPKGQFWGRVNYCPGGVCGIDPKRRPSRHIHIVWQKGNELRRDYVRSDYDPCNINDWDYDRTCFYMQSYYGTPMQYDNRHTRDNDAKGFTEDYNAFLETIKALPQLFIAV